MLESSSTCGAPGASADYDVPSTTVSTDPWNSAVRIRWDGSFRIAPAITADGADPLREDDGGGGHAAPQLATSGSLWGCAPDAAVTGAGTSAHEHTVHLGKPARRERQPDALPCGADDEELLRRHPARRPETAATRVSPGQLGSRVYFAFGSFQVAFCTPLGPLRRIVIDSGVVVAFLGTSNPMQPGHGLLGGEQQFVRGEARRRSRRQRIARIPVTRPSEVCSVVPLVVRVGSMTPFVWPVTNTPTSLLPGCARCRPGRRRDRRPCRP